ncbi:MAG TPA: prefoldin subunit alpha [Candidatus Thermoplasmatota archaeon]
MAESSREAQEAALTLELYQRQLAAVSRQIDFLQGVHDEIIRAQRTLEGLGEATDQEVLVPMGASAFIAGKIDPTSPVIVGIGAGYATERTREEAIAILELRRKQSEGELDAMMQTAVQLQQEAARLSDEGSDDEP